MSFWLGWTVALAVLGYIGWGLRTWQYRRLKARYDALEERYAKLDLIERTKRALSDRGVVPQTQSGEGLPGTGSGTGGTCGRRLDERSDGGTA